jgi:DNA-binding transcriptional LysR family regulator
MTLEQLRIFLAVVENLHFTRAAEELYITQPAVSAAIQSLEREYSVKLFHRVGRRIEVTDAGRLLKLEAQKILEQVALTERGLRELNDLKRGELRLGSSLTIGNYWLPDKISEFQAKYPGISVQCTLANAGEICEGTASGLFDLGVITGEVKSTLKDVLESEVVDSDRLQIVVGKSHPWYERAEITLDQLTTSPWIMRESGSGIQHMFEQALQNWGIALSDLKIVLILSTSEMVKAVVEGGVGAAAISEMMIQKELKLTTLRSVQIVDTHNRKKRSLEMAQSVLMIKHRQRFQTRLAIAFEQMLFLSDLKNLVAKE